MAALEYYGKQYRNMWCTEDFLHTVESSVTTDGAIVSLDQTGITSSVRF
jgi:hypothetical protein